MSQPEISLGRFVANSAFTGTPFRFVKLSSGKLVLCGAGESGLGVIQDEPIAGEPGNVMIIGVSKVECGDTIGQGDPVKSDASGKGVPASDGDITLGTALEAGADGEVIDVLILGPSQAEAAIIPFEVPVPAVATNVDNSVVVGRMASDVTVTGATFIPAANITGADTNYREIQLVNKGLDGNGTTVVAAISFTNGIDATDFNETALTLSSTPSDLDIDEGEVLAWVSTSPGTGLADPGGLACITVQRR